MRLINLINIPLGLMAPHIVFYWAFAGMGLGGTDYNSARIIAMGALVIFLIAIIIFNLLTLRNRIGAVQKTKTLLVSAATFAVLTFISYEFLIPKYEAWI